MSLQDTEDNCVLTCGHCNVDVGRINNIIEEDLASKHHCFRNFENIEMDFDTKKIYGSIRELDSSSEPSTSTCCASTVTDPAPASTLQENINLANARNGETGEGKCSWTHEAIKLLIFSFIKNKDKFDSPTYTKKKVWQIICDELERKGIARTYQKCDEKWRNLKKTYDKIRAEKNKTGNHAVHWRYFEDFHEIYFRDPYFKPIVSVSSTGLTKTTSSEKPVDNDANKPGGSKNFSPGELSRKRTLSSYEIENRRQKRHEDKMNLKKEMFRWMQENFGKK